MQWIFCRNTTKTSHSFFRSQYLAKLINFWRLSMAEEKGIVNGLVNILRGNNHENVVPNECRFCRIAGHKSCLEKDALLFEDEEIIVFHDHRAAARHHLLVVPKAHIRDCRSLNMEHLPLLDRLVETGKLVMDSRLIKENAKTEIFFDVKMGFHYPPNISVPHLHLHVIAPYSKLKKSQARKFSPDYFWFVSPDFVKYQIEKRSGAITSISAEDVTKFQWLEKWLCR